MVKLSKHNVQVIYLYASTLLGSLLGFVISIVNTHFLSESDYGDVRYVQNIATLLSWFFFWGYFYAGRRLLALSTEEQQSRSIRGGLAVMLLLGVLCQVFSILMISVLHNDRVGISHLLLMSIPVCCQPLLTSYVSVINQGDKFFWLGNINATNPPRYANLNSKDFPGLKVPFLFGKIKARIFFVMDMSK